MLRFPHFLWIKWFIYSWFRTSFPLDSLPARRHPDSQMNFVRSLFIQKDISVLARFKFGIPEIWPCTLITRSYRVKGAILKSVSDHMSNREDTTCRYRSPWYRIPAFSWESSFIKNSLPLHFFGLLRIIEVSVRHCFSIKVSTGSDSIACPYVRSNGTDHWIGFTQ